MLDEATYVCDACGETIVVPVEPGTGAGAYVEDCPVCCNPMVLDVRWDDEGRARIDARAE